MKFDKILQILRHDLVFALLDRIVSRHILSGSLTSNSCSAALTCVFVLRDEFAFSFQTFSRSDPPGKAALTRGRYVLKNIHLEISDKFCGISRDILQNLLLLVRFDEIALKLPQVTPKLKNCV